MAEGTSFENSACNTPVCSASRATWFTGRLPSQHNTHDWISRGNGCPGDAPGLNYTQGEVFTTDILTAMGYAAGITGKVHLGNQPVPQHGFEPEHYFVHQSGGGDYNNAPLIVDLECTNVPGYVTYVLANRTIDELRSYKAASKPFIHHLHFTAPHAPVSFTPCTALRDCRVSGTTPLMRVCRATFRLVIRSMLGRMARRTQCTLPTLLPCTTIAHSRHCLTSPKTPTPITVPVCPRPAWITKSAGRVTMPL